MSADVLRDVELVLAGILTGGHELGAAVGAAATSPGRVVLTLDDSAREAALAAGTVLLVDDEMTPLATLDDLTPTAAGRVDGVLRAQRRRESGSGRDLALGPDDSALRWRRVLVLGRPALPVDEEALGTIDAVVVPDLTTSTAGVPTSVMVQLAQRLAGRLGGIPVRTAPLAWRDPASDTALVAAVGHYLGGAQLTRLSNDASVDPGAPAWNAVARLIDERADEVALPLPDSDADVLRRWRPARHSRGLVIMLSGFSGSGKSTVARGLAAALETRSVRTVSLLDGDVVRQMLSSGLGFDRASRILNVRRIGYVGSEIARHGGIAICAPIAPYASTRADVRAMAETVGDFVLVHVNTPLEECERRDLKGLYAKARAGLIPEFTGISDPYDIPDDADLRVDTSTLTPDEAVGLVFDHLVRGGWVRPVVRT
jgi:sulfate adenylyltransferase